MSASAAPFPAEGSELLVCVTFHPWVGPKLQASIPQARLSPDSASKRQPEPCDPCLCGFAGGVDPGGPGPIARQFDSCGFGDGGFKRELGVGKTNISQ